MVAKNLICTVLLLSALEACADKKKFSADVLDAKAAAAAASSKSGEDSIVASNSQTDSIVSQTIKSEQQADIIGKLPAVPVVTPPGGPITMPPAAPVVTPPVGTIDEPKTSVEFGSDQVFRIGDGFAGAGSACAGEVKSYDLQGSTYYFQFKIIEDDTTINLSINQICGVDNPALTLVSMINIDSNAVVRPEILMPTDAASDRTKPYLPFAASTLKAGQYSIVIKSKSRLTPAEAASAQPGVDQFDDFIVGKIQVKADKLVQAIKVTTTK